MSTFQSAIYQPVIGLEIHAQLQTDSKIFASDAVRFGREANTLISPISLGHPGTLPFLNIKVVEYAIKMGIAIGSEIAEWQHFDRKNYFYPDLPKGYQITQDKTPICVGGKIKVKLKSEEKYISFHHIHLEEDAGKSLHEGDNPYSFIDYNRAGTPLIEMVTDPTLHSSEEAFALVSEVRKLVRYLGICDGNMEEGSLRADVNISLRPIGTEKLGTKVEIKNMNSIRNIQRAIEFECTRQAAMLDAGEIIIQETRTFDAHSGKTSSMRVKETMNDYRYFPEPDLAPLHITQDWIHEVRATMPLLPWEQEQELIDQFGLPAYDAHFLAETKEMALFFKEAATHTKAYKALSNWLMGPVKSHMNESLLHIQDFEINPENLAEIVDLVEQGLITHNLAAHQLFPLCLQETSKSPKQLVDEYGWGLADNNDELINFVQDVIGAFPDKVKEYHKGKKGLIALFIGEVMKRSKGKADPKVVNQLVQEALAQ
ncbi:Asp-tRNA(Asn)/Glu-tRNA(Gln) amidotransferase subunit GatB [Aquirufa ecclesiirivi]|uniref:Aspartyl/glutamyl-tRNA(Asn/Gln) amidotransferase subunit B n=1 Tax=Aquirufa ecclesiirivi TaxID=2715124 RepID=A0ABT4JJE1_9BACT|nr:Asp-tRNA(Asn)/Glu-tRNA(Gln) amidotransferase subunit GatB [Aquirufa ecclesiirivi]MCZ2476093.1 Asp-tRNA(Asn)/Glu-tRNA(Gln) amidotransferase subunit GatB [Aquirufa ecclesiirivi]